MEEKMVDRLIRLSGQNENERDIILYGLEMVLYNLMVTIVFLFLGIVTNTLLETAVFLIIHVVVQRKTGGYHATTRIGCFIVTAVAWFGVSVMVAIQERYHILSYPMVILICIGMITATAICAPVEHKNKPLTKEVRKRNRIISIVLMASFSILLLVLWFYLPMVSSAILTTLLELAVSIIIREGGKRNVS